MMSYRSDGKPLRHLHPETKGRKLFFEGEKATGPEQKYSDDFEIPNATFTKQTPILRDPENSRDVVLLSLSLNAKDS